MATMNIQRNARVEAADGEVGRVHHVIVDPQTQEVTDLVVGQDGQEWLVPMSAVAGVEGDRVRLRGPWSQYQAAGLFNRDDFVPVDPEEVRAETQRRAVRGGAPLVDAAEDAVHVGGTPEAAPAPERPRPQRETPAGREQPYRLQLAQEHLRVAKRQEEAGTVTIAKRVTERTEALDVPVREEQVIIERRPVAGEVPAGDQEIGEGEVVEVPVMKERVVVSKEPVVVEEVIVRKETIEHTEHVEETVRKEELMVDDPQDRVTGRGEGATEPNREQRTRPD